MEEIKYKFQNISLYTSKLSDLYHFYIERLGFRCTFQNKDKFHIDLGENELIFLSGKEDCIYHFAFNIPENQIEESRQWISNFTEILDFKGDEIIDFKNWNAHSLYFEDPAGNIVEFIARHNLNNASNMNFSAESILGISEIGIVTKDISQMLGLYDKELNFSLFWGDHEKFAAAGHEKSLLITVPEDRPWFPTENRIGKYYPLKVELRKGDVIKTLKTDDGGYIIF